MPLRTTVTINLSVPTELAEALDDRVIDLQRMNPETNVTRSAVAVEAISAYLARTHAESKE